MQKIEINKYITIELRKKTLKLYVEGVEFHEGRIPRNFKISASENFNNLLIKLQKWVENDYNPDLNEEREDFDFYFPLLKRLYEIGEPIAKKTYIDEISRQFLRKNYPIIEYFIKKKYIDELDKNQLQEIMKKFDFTVLFSKFHRVGLNLLSNIADLDISIAKQELRKSIFHYFKEVPKPDDLYLIEYGYLKYLDSNELSELMQDYNYKKLLELSQKTTEPDIFGNYDIRSPLSSLKYLSNLTKVGDPVAKELLLKRISPIFSNKENIKIYHILTLRFLEALDKENIELLLKSLDYSVLPRFGGYTSHGTRHKGGVPYSIFLILMDLGDNKARDIFITENTKNIINFPQFEEIRQIIIHDFFKYFNKTELELFRLTESSKLFKNIKSYLIGKLDEKLIARELLRYILEHIDHSLEEIKSLIANKDFLWNEFGNAFYFNGDYERAKYCYSKGTRFIQTFQEFELEIKNCHFVQWHPTNLFLIAICYDINKWKEAKTTLLELNEIELIEEKLVTKKSHNINIPVKFKDIKLFSLHPLKPLLLILTKSQVFIWNYEKQIHINSLPIPESTLFHRDFVGCGFFSSIPTVFFSDFEAIGIWNYETGEYKEYFTIYWNDESGDVKAFLHPSEKLIGILAFLGDGDIYRGALTLFLTPLEPSCEICQFFNLNHGGTAKYLDNQRIHDDSKPGFYRQLGWDVPISGDIHPNGKIYVIITVDVEKSNHYNICLYDLFKGTLINEIALSSEEDLFKLSRKNYSIQFSKSGERIVHHINDNIIFHDSELNPIKILQPSNQVKQISCHKFYAAYVILLESKLLYLMENSLEEEEIIRNQVGIIEEANDIAKRLIDTYDLIEYPEDKYLCNKNAIKQIQYHFKKGEFDTVEKGLRILIDNIKNVSIEYILESIPEIAKFDEVWEISDLKVKEFIKSRKS